MKKVLPVLTAVLVIWGCAKKMTPTQSESNAPATNTGSVINNPGKTGETGSAGTAAPGNTGMEGTKTAPVKERTAGESAAIAGQATFNAKCGKCHGLKPAGDYTAERWAQILAVMAPKANLSETERSNVYEYVKANAKK
ncbi:MAG TPA: cytochrome c [Ferruginibacter sp.]|nr:cytochrome c [Ferruginibacter sp.]